MFTEEEKIRAIELYFNIAKSLSLPYAICCPEKLI